MNYILDENKQVKPEPNILKWAEMFESLDRIVKQETIRDIFISTVFLGIDHRFMGDGPPLVFETMVFSKDNSEHICERCSTYEEAIQQHNKIKETIQMHILKECNCGFAMHKTWMAYLYCMLKVKRKKR